MVLALAVYMDGEGKIFAGLKQVQLFLEQQRVGAHVNVLFTFNQSGNNFVNAGVHKRLAARDGYYRCAAFLHGLEAFFRRKLLFEDVGRVLDLATTCAGKVAAEQRLQHEDERIALASCEFLLYDVARYSPHL